MKIQIKSWDSGKVLFETDGAIIRDAVRAAIVAKANLRNADLGGANLRNADLWGANLSGANLRNADLCGVNLRGANLSGADLCGANLRNANLRNANLRSANLRGANLSGVNLRNADLSTDDIQKIISIRTILPGGDLIGWKKIHGNSGDVICKLKIPAKAKRVGGLVGRKCRAEFAIVISGSGHSGYNPNFQYAKGKTVKSDKFDPNPLEECSNGIHFFITRAEAEAYTL